MTILALLGPTASGKSALARQVVQARIAAGHTTEIVAVDAFTVYRGMDIGTAKPTAAERDAIVHHLVDVIGPDEDLTVATFQQLARAAIGEVLDRGATPLLVGGSGLYWRAVVDDLRFPPTDPAVRRQLMGQWIDDPPGAHGRLATLDPAAAARIDPHNLRRTVRALEVITITGVPFSSFARDWDTYTSIYPDLDVALLDPPTEDLRDAIADRARRMIADGLVDEARALRERHRLSPTARQAIGYAEAFAVLDGAAPLDGLADAIATRTWRYARRQRSWFRCDPRCVVVDPAGLAEVWAAR
jgi:tRNA dimethylallyltransferase